MDVRPGGVWRFVMHSPDGVDFDNAREYHAVEMGHQTFDRFAAYLVTRTA